MIDMSWAEHKYAAATFYLYAFIMYSSCLKLFLLSWQKCSTHQMANVKMICRLDTLWQCLSLAFNSISNGKRFSHLHLPFDVKNMFAIIKETAYDAPYSITVKAVISSLSWYKSIPIRADMICSLLDVLWGQPIKLIQVISTSEFHEYWWNDLEIIFLVPAAQKLEHKVDHNYFTV